MTIYKGKKAVCGIQLTVDHVWRYGMQEGDVLDVEIKDECGNIIAKTYTAEDSDSKDKQITVELSEAETNMLECGFGTFEAYLNGLCVVPRQLITINEG